MCLGKGEGKQVLWLVSPQSLSSGSGLALPLGAHRPHPTVPARSGQGFGRRAQGSGWESVR